MAETHKLLAKFWVEEIDTRTTREETIHPGDLLFVVSLHYSKNYAEEAANEQVNMLRNAKALEEKIFTAENRIAILLQELADTRNKLIAQAKMNEALQKSIVLRHPEVVQMVELLNKLMMEMAEERAESSALREQMQEFRQELLLPIIKKDKKHQDED